MASAAHRVQFAGEPPADDRRLVASPLGVIFIAAMERATAMKIYCPVCEYHPRASDRWQCRPGCYTIWNTFETRAVCPGCSKQWRDTWCPACGVASPHEDWYHEEELDRASETREEEMALT